MICTYIYTFSLAIRLLSHTTLDAGCIPLAQASRVRRGLSHSRTPLSGVAVFYLASQKFLPARRLRAYDEGSPGDGSHVSAIRVRLHPLPYIPSCRWIPGAHNGEHAKGEGQRGGPRRRSEKDMRKEKETSRASCIHYGGLTAMAMRVADTRGTRGPRGPGGIRRFIRKGRRKVLSQAVRRQVCICIERLKFCVLVDAS